VRLRRNLILVVVIALASAALVISSTLSSGDSAGTHTMPDGSTMQGDRMP
jgi:hypothetical protein